MLNHSSKTEVSSLPDLVRLVTSARDRIESADWTEYARGAAVRFRSSINEIDGRLFDLQADIASSGEPAALHRYWQHIVRDALFLIESFTLPTE